MEYVRAKPQHAADKRIIYEHRALFVTIGCTFLGVLLMFIAISTDYWVILSIPGGQYRNATRGYVFRLHSGLFRVCRDELDNSTYPIIQRQYCQMAKFFPSEEEVKKNPEIDYSILDYSRTETAFAVIGLVLMCLGCIFSVYAFNHARYMYKRLAALVHLITAICTLVSIEVMMTSVQYEKENLPARHPHAASISYGYSFVLAWIVFIIFLIATIVFAVCSKKRKGENAVSEEAALENEPVHIGRL